MAVSYTKVLSLHLLYIISSNSYIISHEQIYYIFPLGELYCYMAKWKSNIRNNARNI